VLEPTRGRASEPASEEASTLVLTGVGQRAILEALGSARGSQRVRGREAFLLAAALDVRGVTSAAGIPIVSSCALLVASLAPTPITRSESAAEPLETLAPVAPG
jgi:hypothetical protein